MQSILTCVTQAHNPRLMLLAGSVCIAGIYASFSVANQAVRSEGAARRNWAGISIVAAGCTAWATHMIALLAFDPGMAAGFEPIMTALSLLTGIGGIGLGMALAVGRRHRLRRLAAGLILGLGIAALHYLGQASYRVTGQVAWDMSLVAGSCLMGLTLFGLALMMAGERNRGLRRFGAPLVLAAIVVLHIGGMSAVTLTFDPEVALPSTAVPPATIAPILAAVSLGLLILAFVGLRLTLHARAQQQQDQQRLRDLANIALEGLAVCDGEVIATANHSLERLS